MPLYSDAIKNPASKKIVLAKGVFLKQFFAWTLSGTAGIWYQSSAEEVERVQENEAVATEVATFAALVALSVAALGGWFYDADAELLYYKAITGTTAFENFVIGDIVFRFAEFPVEDNSGRPHDAKILSAPAIKLAISHIFETKAGRIGSGSMGVETTDYLFSRKDFEPDGSIEITESIEV